MTTEASTTKQYNRKVSNLEHLFSRSPFSIVTMVARIKGDVSEGALRMAIFKVQQRHPNLRVRIKEDEHHHPWFTTEGAGEIPVEVVPRESEHHWIDIHHEASKIPFEFDQRPPIRFILVHSSQVSELIILCHHIICDGMSLAYLARDLIVHLGNPESQVDVLPDPVIVDQDSIPEDVTLNGVIKYFLKKINAQWDGERIHFDWDDYRDLNETYWSKFRHQVIPVELSEEETTALVQRCRDERVTVNTALTAAFVGAQYAVQGDQPYHSKIGVAGDLRGRLKTPIDEVMGFYAGIVMPKFKYKSKLGFWENARKLHRKLTPLYTNVGLFKQHLMWCYLEPDILEAINFKKLGGLVPKALPRYQKLADFSKRDDAVLGILKRGKMDSLEDVIMGTAVTNLTRLDFPRNYGDLELDRLIMNPGGAFPLVTVNVVVGAVTCAGKLSLLLEFAEERIDPSTMEEIKDQAIQFLFE